MSEVFNKYVLDVRKKPIRTMCDGIKDKQMVRWHRNRESGKKARWEITPHYSEKLEVEKERAKYCKPIQAGVDLWQVTSGQQTHAVNLQMHTCGCRKWDRSPCQLGTLRGPMKSRGVCEQVLQERNLSGSL